MEEQTLERLITAVGRANSLLPTPIISYLLIMVNIIAEISMCFLAVLSLFTLPYNDMKLIDYFVLVSAILCIVSFIVLFFIELSKRRNDNEIKKDKA